MSKISDEYIQVTRDPRQIDGDTADIIVPNATIDTVKAKNISAQDGATLTIETATINTPTLVTPTLTNAVINGTVSGTALNVANGIPTLNADSKLTAGIIADLDNDGTNLSYKDQVVSSTDWVNTRDGTINVNATGNLEKISGFRPPLEILEFSSGTTNINISANFCTTIITESETFAANTSSTLAGLNNTSADIGKIKNIVVRDLSSAKTYSVNIDAGTELRDAFGTSISTIQFTKICQSVQLIWLGTMWAGLGSGATFVEA